MIGRTISHYQILEKLGEGGMGVVYKARDIHLDRFVAVKILPPEKVVDPERKRRFVQEAKAASALSHPNIIHVYDIDQADDIDYIAMEYVAGKRLDQLIPWHGMPLTDVLKCAVQIADALAAAHGAGIVHRDLKPGNVMVNDPGQVKVLDFGLAKQTETAESSEASDTRTMGPQTEEGTILGTIAYMSPEQAEGKPLDFRSDIFSFGTLLYEMVTGRRAFEADSTAATLAALLHENPKLPSEVVEGIPPELERIIERCLRKQPEKRFQSTSYLKFALEDIADDLEAGRPVRAGVKIERSATSRWLWLVTVPIGVAVIAAIWWGWRPGEAPQPAPLTLLTGDAGLSIDPTLSSDGKLVAYASDRAGDGDLDIWVQQRAGGAPIRLTQDPGVEREPMFSPDGNTIAFRSDRDGGGIYVIPALGREARLVVKGGRNPRFSPDGSEIAYWVGRGTRGRVQVVPPRGGTPRDLLPESDQGAYPVWSPDGKHVLMRDFREQQYDAWVVPATGGPAMRTGLYDYLRERGFEPWQQQVVWQWLPGNVLLFSARLGDSTNLWSIQVSEGSWKVTGEARRITSGAGVDTSPSVAAGVLAFASLRPSTDIYSAPLEPNRGVLTGDAVRLTERSSPHEMPSVTERGDKVAYRASRFGSLDVWLLDRTRGKDTALTSTPAGEWSPLITWDGSGVTYYFCDPRDCLGYFLRQGEVIPELLCKGCRDPVLSRDGAWILHTDPAVHGLYLQERASGGRTALVHDARYNIWQPGLSPDGRWACFATERERDTCRVHIIPARGNGPVAESAWITIGAGHWDDKPRWSLDGNLLYFVSDRDGYLCIWAQDLDPVTKQPRGEPRAVYHAHGSRRSLANTEVSTLDISISRDKLVFNMTELAGSIWTTASHGGVAEGVGPAR
jgi:Tol biopolymer transport system component/predicted Ser/Thr protein kinase